MFGDPHPDRLYVTTHHLNQHCAPAPTSDRPQTMFTLILLFHQIFQATCIHTFDIDKVEETAVGKYTNLVRNPSIEEYDPITFKPTWWQPFINDYTMTSSRKAHQGKKSLTFNLYRSKWVGCGQLVYVDQTIPKDLELSAWVSAYSLNIDFNVYADVRYLDGTSEQDYTLSFGKGTYRWTRKSMLLSARPNKPIQAVMIYFVMQASRALLGSSYLDDISLIELSTSSYVPLIQQPFNVGAPQGMTSSGLPVKPHWCVAGQVCDTDLTQLHMHNYFLTASTTPKNNDITLVTQLSPDRLHRIQQLAQVWKGPISAAVYVGHDTYNGVKELLSLWGTSELVRQHVDFHLVSSDAIGKTHESNPPYPINALRNLAWSYSRTNQLFLLDVDFIPNPNMRKYCVDLWPKLRAVPGLKKSVYVVPGFESFSELKKWPKNRKDVKQMSKVDLTLQPVHADKLASAHAAVDYNRWYDTKNPYRVNYKLYFEPYLLIDKLTTPQYDTRFSGYGHDKSSHTYHLHLAGYNFIVLPDAFVVHIDHGVPTWRNNANKTRIWVNWYSFALEKEAKFGTIDSKKPKLFFAPEWWGVL